MGAQSPRWLINGVVTPQHRRVRALSRLPGRAKVLWRLESGSSSVGLTFDDGPDWLGTPTILAVLSELRCRATFFVLTERLQAAGSLAREASRAGHRIGLHGDRHEALDRLTTRRCAARLHQARIQLEDSIGAAVKLYRPPYGRTSASLLGAAHRTGLHVVLWSHDPRDWEPNARHPLTDRLSRCMEPGAVVLLHDRHEARGGGLHTASALSAAVAVARRRGLSFCALPAVGGP